MHAGPSQDNVHRPGAGLRGVAITGCTIEDLGGEGISMADPHAQDVRLRPVSDLSDSQFSFDTDALNGGSNLERRC